MKISELINEDNVTINVTPAALREFAYNIIDEYRRTAEKATQEDERLSMQQAAQYLGKSVPTLWRWKKEGYLVPDGQTGNSPYYLKSTLLRLGKY